MTASVAHSATSPGLTAVEVADRVDKGLVNTVEEHTRRSFAHIVRANVFTRFNAILGTLMVLVIATGFLAGRDVRPGHDRQLAGRHRAGDPRQTQSRPAGGPPALVVSMGALFLIAFAVPTIRHSLLFSISPWAVVPAVLIGLAVAALLSVAWRIATPEPRIPHGT